MKISEIKEQNKEELETKLADIKKTLFNLKFQKATGQLNSPVKIRNLRKDIARIKTLIREKELEAKTDSKDDKVNKK
jgi:large subunit ribosomal protein L29